MLLIVVHKMIKPDGAVHKCADFIQRAGQQLIERMACGIMDQCQTYINQPLGQSFFGLVAKDDHHTGCFAVLFFYGRGAVSNGDFSTGPGDKKRVVGQFHYLSFPEHPCKRAFNRYRLFRRKVVQPANDAKYVFQRFSTGLPFLPTGQCLGNGIHAIDISMRICHNHSIADGVEDGTMVFLALAQQLLRSLLIGNIINGQDGEFAAIK